MANLPDLDWDNIGPVAAVSAPLAGAGSLTLVGVKPGTPVKVIDTVTGADVSSSFESTISVANQIQQIAAIPGNHPVKIVAKVR